MPPRLIVAFAVLIALSWLMYQDPGTPVEPEPQEVFEAP